MGHVKAMRRFGTFNLLKKASLQVMSIQLNEKYTAGLASCFMGMDESGEGQISASEMRKALMESGIDEDDLPPDFDGSGELGISEFVAACLEPQIYQREEFCWAVFRLFDQNCSGGIGVKELYTILNNGCDLKEKRQRIPGLDDPPPKGRCGCCTRRADQKAEAKYEKQQEENKKN